MLSYSIHYFYKRIIHIELKSGVRFPPTRPKKAWQSGACQAGGRVLQRGGGLDDGI